MGAACCSDVGKAAPAQPPIGSYGGPELGPSPASSIPGQAPAPGWAAPGPHREQQQHVNGKVEGKTPSSSIAAASASHTPAPSGAPDQFISQVGELPKFDKPKCRGGSKVHDDSSSEISTASTHLSGVSELVDSISAKDQKQQAKAVVKDFVRVMVKGRKMNVIAPDGSLKTCTCSLSRSLDTLRIKVKSNSRNIQLCDIEEIHAGADVEGLQIQTPLDELSATLMLPSEESITFRLNDVNDRDTFVMCLLMFCNNQK